MPDPSTATVVPPSDLPAENVERRAFRFTMVVAGVFTLMIWLAMVLAQMDARPADLLKPEQIQAVHQKLRLSPNDEQLKTQIRELDLQLRRAYFRQLSLTTGGSLLLLAGVVVFLLAAKRIVALDRKPPLPSDKPDAARTAARVSMLARWSVAALGGATVVGLLTLTLTVGTILPGRLAELEKMPGDTAAGGATVASDLPSPEDYSKNWPRFRGPEGSGVSKQANTPLTWDAATGRGVVWKVAVPAPGFNSPVVWGQRVFLSGGDAARRAVYCLDADTGKNLWERTVEKVPGSPVKLPELHEQPGFAASTMATDGRRIYVLFANGDLAAFTLEGNPVWSKNLGVPHNPYGHASSLATWQDRLLVQWDQGEAEENQSKLFAFDGSSGQVLWQRQRPVGSSWTTPIVITAAGKPQIITVSLPLIIAYAASDGAEIWRVEGMNGEVTPSAVFAGGLVLAISPTEKLMAIRPDGQGNVTQTHIAWNSEEGIPDVTSPVSDGELAFTVTSGGFLTCHDAKDGKKQWEQDYETDCHASPSIASGRLYLTCTKGLVAVVEISRQYTELARTQMADSFFASPAFARDRIYLRGATNVYCLGATEQKVARQ